MANLIVGNEDCSILDVWTILSNSYIIKEKWSDFAGYLRIPSEDIEKLRLDQLHDKINRNDILKKILLLWVADQGSNAKLEELTRVVENECGDNYVGEKLRRAKNLPRKSFQNISTNWTALSSALEENDDKNISKFFPQIPNGAEYCSMHDVWTIISKSEVIKEKWSDFAGFLRIPLEDIERLRQALLLDKINPNYVLIQVLLFWVGHQAGNAQLSELIRIVEDECFDNSVGEKLRLAHNLPCKNFQSGKTTWELLAPAFQTKIGESISEFFPNIPIDSVKSKLQGDVLLDLMTGKKPTMFESILPPSPAFYLKRVLLPRHTISEKVFEEAVQDMFLFTGLNEFDLGKLVKSQDTSTSDEQLDSSEIHVRFLILKLKNHFEKICKKAKVGTPVHLLSYEKNTGKLKWVQTHGSVKLLQRFVEESQNPFTEEQLFMSLENKKNGPIIISDGPGMGKSFLLANIALKLQKSGDKIVLFTSVNDFIKQVKNNSGYDKTTQDSIRVTLQNLICKNDLGILELPPILSATDIKIELLLDGFDEISMNEVALALDRIKIINESFKSIRLWITTRPHYLEELENKLIVLGYNIKGLDEEDQVHFLVSQWQHSKTDQNESNLDKDKLELYAHKVLRTTKSKLNKDDNDVAGAPLQCLLIGEVYEEDCIAFASGTDDTESLPTIRINSISNLYENMITKKFKKYIETHVTTEFAGMDYLICAHVDLSIKLLFPGHSPQLECIQVDLKDLLNIGIIQASGAATNFIHRTFAEYFVAGYVVERLSKGEIENSTFPSFFLEEILMRKQHLYHILPGKYNSIESYRFVHQIIGYFINDCISQAGNLATHVRFAIEEPSKRMEISHACANSSFLQIFKLFFDVKYARLDETLLLLGIRNSMFEYFTFVISCLGESIASFEEQQLSDFLRVAVLRSEPSIVKYLIRRPAFSELIENVNDSTKLLLHDCISNTKYKPSDDIEKRVGVIQHLVEISPNLLEEKDDNGRTPLLCENAHVSLLKELIRLGADISSQDMLGDTVLHLSQDETRRFNAHEYDSLLKCIPKHQLAKVLSATNNDEETILERLLYYIDPTEETFNVLFQGQTSSVQELFEMAVANGRNSQTLKILIKYGVDISWRNKRGASYLHQASLYGNVEALKLLIKEFSFDVNIKDDLMSTPMDYAILSDVSDSNRYETAKLLHNYGGRASEQPKHALNQAIKDGNTESVRIIQEILKFGNENVQSGISRESELKGSHLSVDQYRLLVKDFVGKNKSFRDSDGSSLLHVTAYEGDELAVKELVENGADLNDRDFYGNTPIHNACFCNDLVTGLRIIKFLIDSGADAYAMDENNHTFVSRLVAHVEQVGKSKKASWEEVPPARTWRQVGEKVTASRKIGKKRQSRCRFLRLMSHNDIF